MLSQYLSGINYFEFPSFTVAIFTILLALTLGTVIAFSYKVTFQEEHFSKKLFQAIIISPTLSAMVMMAVGADLKIGLWVLGAISIISFRSLIRKPRNIIFIFASLSIGVATGIFSYAIAISSTTIFCYIMFLLYYTPFESD